MNQKIIDYCAEEVRRQGRGPLEVAHMLRAWSDAMSRYASIEDVNRLTIKDILLWGHLIEPTLNPPDEFRYMQIYVGNYTPPRPEHVRGRMERLVETIKEGNITAEEAYFEFEHIHPFRDGNGRTGKIILNLLNGTMHDPVWPTNKWGIRNP